MGRGSFCCLGASPRHEGEGGGGRQSRRTPHHSKYWCQAVITVDVIKISLARSSQSSLGNKVPIEGFVVEYGL
jgi:hypothetical protein